VRKCIRRDSSVERSNTVANVWHASVMCMFLAGRKIFLFCVCEQMHASEFECGAQQHSILFELRLLSVIQFRILIIE